jgi:transglutaminase-like putative cysteine protease
LPSNIDWGCGPKILESAGNYGKGRRFNNPKSLANTWENPLGIKKGAASTDLRDRIPVPNLVLRAFRGLPIRKSPHPMKQIRIIHNTEYHYSEPVTFGPHRLLMRPREGHDLRILGARVKIEPEASLRWLRDIEGNSVGIATFLQAAERLKFYAEIDVLLRDEPMVECLIDPQAVSYPFQYPPDEQVELVPFRLPSYPYDGPALYEWTRELYQPGQLIDTWELLQRLNTHIFESNAYEERWDPGVQLPHETISRRSGSCRDFAVLMMEAARHLGFAARFVTGYIQMSEGQHGSTHAWTEIYVPGAGWQGFDPTNNKRAGVEHISVAVARAQEKAAPIAGSWTGPSNAFQRMDVQVQVVAQDMQSMV